MFRRWIQFEHRIAHIADGRGWGLTRSNVTNRQVKPYKLWSAWVVRMASSGGPSSKRSRSTSVGILVPKRQAFVSLDARVPCSQNLLLPFPPPHKPKCSQPLWHVSTPRAMSWRRRSTPSVRVDSSRLCVLRLPRLNVPYRSLATEGEQLWIERGEIAFGIDAQN